MNAKNQSYYIPVTMDELMARFLTNFERNKCKSKFKIEKQPLYVKDLSGVDVVDIENSVKHSFDALKNLLSNNTIEMER
jgi:hypothetical protein